MKVGILTYHFAINYGAVLQAYALATTIKAEIPNSQPYIIDLNLRAIQVKDKLRILPISTSLQTIRSGFKTIDQRITKEQLFKDFVRDNFEISQGYTSYRQLRLNPPEAEIYICGSDQVWNPFITFGNIKPYLFEFITDHRKIKVSYAASIGGTKIKPKYHQLFRKELKNFSSISLREEAGVNAVKSLTDKEVIQTLDPTLLLAKEQWQELQAPIEYHDYILIYNIFPSKKIYEVAAKLKAETGLQVIEISRYGEKPEFLDHPLIAVSPAQFLTFFANANYILTNSFHGTSFSIIYQKPFMAFASTMYTNRISNLLTTSQITSQLYNEQLDSSHQLSKHFYYNTEVAMKCLEPEIIKSKQFIANIKENNDQNR